MGADVVSCPTTGCLKKWVLPNWAFADPASNWGEILNEICGKSSCIMLWVGNFNAFIGRFVDTALGAYRVWKGALKNKRLHKNNWFVNIILTGINPTTLDLLAQLDLSWKITSISPQSLANASIGKTQFFLRHPVIRPTSQGNSHLIYILLWLILYLL